MNELITKAVLSGLGFASLTGEVMRDTVNDLVKRSKLSEAEGKRLVKNLQRRSAVAERTLKKNVNAAVDKALKQLDLERIPHPSRASKRRTAKPSRTGHKSH
jgi:polyhydroxyalkanoate synthesis regulator phasin